MSRHPRNTGTTIVGVAVTLTELEDRLRAILDEPAAAQWEQDNIRRWFNDGLRDLARSTRHYKDTHEQALTADLAEYTMPANILAIELAYYDDGTRTYPMAGRHYESMDQVWGSWQDRQGWPRFYTTWGNSPNLKLRLYPVPTDSTHKAQLLTAVLPTEMPLVGSDATNVDVPDGWVDAIVDYAAYLAFLRDRTIGPDGRMMWETMHRSYVAKRNDLVHSNDYMAINREFVPEPRVGYVPSWHLDDDDYGWW